MCGIAGHFNFRIAESEARRCLGELARRGPDGTGYFGWNAAGQRAAAHAEHGLLHTRLAIRDLRDVAAQPMSNRAGDLWITYNGEVFGWEQESRTLDALLGPATTTSDTEFILRGYEAWGIDALLPRLRGMYAFAIVDWRRRRVVLARDRLGVKSLVWFHDRRRFAFGSTLRSLLALLPATEHALDRQGIDAYLAHRYVPAPGTCFKAIRRMEAGQLLQFDLDSGALQQSSYWQPRPNGRAFAATVDEAIAQQTVADRPVGVFLSGGVDSTAVACSLARQGYTQLVTFTAGFAGSPHDESAAAASLASRLGLPHIPLEIPEASAEVFDQLVADLDEPFADPACLPLWLLAREAGRHVKVVLSGDGGDELFAGYKRYAAHLRTRWRRGLRIPRRSAAELPQGRWSRMREELGLDWRTAYYLRFSGFSLGERRALQPALEAPATHWRPGWPAGSALEELVAIDFANYLPDYALRKSDLCTMAHGLEQRVPLLDHEVVESAWSLPREVRFTEPRKLAMRPLCPQLAGATYDPFLAPKRGFNPPVGRWLQGELAPRLAHLGDALASATGGQLSAPATQAYVDGYRAGDHRRGEGVLQLLLLAESLQSIAAYCAAPHPCA